MAQILLVKKLVFLIPTTLVFHQQSGNETDFVDYGFL